MRFWWQKENAERQAEEIERIFRNTFSSEDGKVCFTILLEDLKFYDVANTVEAQALKNYATVLLKRIGITDSYGATKALLGFKQEK